MVITEQEGMTFEDVFKQNERRIHYHIHRLNLRDPHQEYFQEGLVALWKAYETYQPDQGPMSTYFNYQIRNRLIDLIRKQSRAEKIKAKLITHHTLHMENGNRRRRQENHYPIMNRTHPETTDKELWQHLQIHLTDKQWKWVNWFIIHDMSVKAIAHQENTTEDAVKSWGRQVRKKLRDETFRKKIRWEINDSF
ncbi:MAG TPA: sigma-70 family RNA polymerase sigma factor [Bacillota bacterium]|nr:sigma-70 family RNA polymerase sigma factor [Bacillota bacterium]